jgi:HEAT repeat protein
VVTALGRIGDRRAAPELCHLLHPGARTDPECRAEAANALGRIGGQEAVPTLLEALTDAYPAVRVCAAAALGHLGAADAIQGLCRALEDPEPGVLQAAAVSLGSLAERPESSPIHLRAAVPALTRLGSPLSTEHGAVKHACRDALRRIEARTASVKGLPLPAQPAATDPLTLPRVSGPEG